MRTKLTFEEREALAEVLTAHGMDHPHDDHAEWDCRGAVYDAVEEILGARRGSE